MIIFGKPIHTHNIICYVFMLLGVGLIYFGVEKGFINDTLVGTLSVYVGVL